MSYAFTHALSIMNHDPRPLMHYIQSGGSIGISNASAAKVLHMLCVNQLRATAEKWAADHNLEMPTQEWADYPSETRPLAIREFDAYCEANSLKQVRLLQAPQYGAHQKSCVWLVQDADGVFKVYKEELDYTQRPVKLPRESEIMQRLYGMPGVPKLYGITEITDNLRFLRMEMVYGQPLTSLCKTVSPISVNDYIAGIASFLLDMLKRGVLYLDLKPENVLVTQLGQSGIVILDYGFAQFVQSPDEVVDIALADPRYAAPESVKFRQASQASLVYQLGVLYYQLIYGKHPNQQCGELSGNFDTDIQYAVDNARWDYHVRNELCHAMLQQSPDKRPSLEEIARNHRLKFRAFFHHNPKPQLGKVLFPARMGIPHKGHLDYMCRLLHIGYHVIISIQYAYIITDRDPLPKWIVADIVRKSLKAYGWVENVHYSIRYAPFYETDQQHKLHFHMMPEWREIVAIASSNPDVHELFSFARLPILEQRSLFAHESNAADYEVRSWGEILRQAVKAGDHKTFQNYAMPRHKHVLSFEQTRALYHEQHIEFVPGRVFTGLYDGDIQIARVPVERYSGPVETLRRVTDEPFQYSCTNFNGTDMVIKFFRCASIYAARYGKIKRRSESFVS